MQWCNSLESTLRTSPPLPKHVPRSLLSLGLSPPAPSTSRCFLRLAGSPNAMAFSVYSQFLPATDLPTAMFRPILAHLVLPIFACFLVGCSSFQPFTQRDLVPETLECFFHLGIPPERIRLYQAGMFPNDPGTWCLVRCVSIKLGVYTDRHGPDVDNLVEQFNSSRKQASSCVTKRLDKYQGACERAYRSVIDCFGKQIRAFLGESAPPSDRRDQCQDCFRMFNELYQSTVMAAGQKPKCGKCRKAARKNATEK